MIRKVGNVRFIRNPIGIKRSRKSDLRLLLTGCCLAAFASAVYGQSTFGTILGTVKDPSGAVVNLVKIDLLNTGTNVTRSTVSNADGSYQFVNIDVGKYKLRIEAPGFQKAEFDEFRARLARNEAS